MRFAIFRTVFFLLNFAFCFLLLCHSPKMNRLPALKSFKFDQENLSEARRQWKGELKLFLQARESDSKPGKVQNSILLTCIGTKERDIFFHIQLEKWWK